jgi:ADP-ribose pyrophosphatase YjhB (NUDIX family)
MVLQREGNQKIKHGFCALAKIMKKALQFTGKVAFWLSLPLLYLYLHSSRRTRVVVVAEGQILLVKSWYGSGKWMLPGGGLHRGEDVQEGAIREVAEETAIRLLPEQLKAFGSAVHHGYGLHYGYERFYAELPKLLVVTPQRHEISEAAWFPIEAIDFNSVETDVIDTVEAWRGLQRLVE